MSGVLNLRIAVCGGGGVGKSCLTIQFVQNQFVETWDPTIEDSYQKQLKVMGTMVMLDILDTAGQEEYKALRDEYMRNADGFLLVFDLSSRKSFQELTEFHKQITRSKDCDFPPIVLAGNKCDLPDDMKKVSVQEAMEQCNMWKCTYLDTSAKERKNVDECFIKIVEKIIAEKKKENNPTQGTDSSEETKAKKKCIIL
jgi:GTPase KRas protein